MATATVKLDEVLGDPTHFELRNQFDEKYDDATVTYDKSKSELTVESPENGSFRLFVDYQYLTKTYKVLVGETVNDGGLSYYIGAGATGPQGPAGAKGDKGADGAKGDRGDPGAPTQAEWDALASGVADLMARVDVLENNDVSN